MEDSLGLALHADHMELCTLAAAKGGGILGWRDLGFWGIFQRKILGSSTSCFDCNFGDIARNQSEPEFVHPSLVRLLLFDLLVGLLPFDLQKLGTSEVMNAYKTKRYKTSMTGPLFVKRGSRLTT